MKRNIRAMLSLVSLGLLSLNMSLTATGLPPLIFPMSRGRVTAKGTARASRQSITVRERW